MGHGSYQLPEHPRGRSQSGVTSFGFLKRDPISRVRLVPKLLQAISYKPIAIKLKMAHRVHGILLWGGIGHRAWGIGCEGSRGGGQEAGYAK